MAGQIPEVEKIYITPGEDFEHYYSADEDDPIPDDTTANITVYSKDWVTTLAVFPASLVEAGGVRFNVQSSDWTPIPAWSRYRFWLSYPGAGSPRVWKKGSVVKV